MCGIIGIKHDSPFFSWLPNLIEQNQKRGKSSKIEFTTPNGRFFHFRAPTSGCSLHNLSEAYPITYKGYGLIGNGIINEKYFKSIKDEENNNDLYYILKGFTEKGSKFLEMVEGCFALVIFTPRGEIFLIKNTFPIYYNNSIFSSVKFGNSQLLKDGILYDWVKNKKIEQIDTKLPPYLT